MINTRAISVLSFKKTNVWEREREGEREREREGDGERERERERDDKCKRNKCVIV